MGVDEHDEDNGTLDVTDSRSAFSFPSASQASGALGSTGAYPSYPQQQYSMYPLPQAPVAVHYPPSQFSAYPQHPVMVGHQFPAPPPTTAGFSAIPPQQLSSSPLTSPVSGAGSLGRRPHQPSQSRPFEDSGASHMKQPSSPPPRRGASTRDDPDSTDQRNRR
ncbi:hypothetical protein BC830DRAFT_1116776 [Chytriomyces sp. MP71]|nr:hypothetical protein BC830DRAFT_1116776 [Chytriomyces sp. MP71]